MGRKEQSRGGHRLYYLAGRQGYLDGKRRSPGARRSRHHVDRAWQVQVHRSVLEPLDRVVQVLVAKAGPISPVAEYLAKADGKWFGIPTTVGSQVKPCCSRLDLYQQHCGIDLKAIFPANPNRDAKLVESWSWDTYLKSAEQLFKAGFP